MTKREARGAFLADVGRRYRRAIALECGLEVEYRHHVVLSVIGYFGDDAAMTEGCMQALDDGVAAERVREVLLQTYAFYGYVRGINNLVCMNAALRQLGRHETEGLPPFTVEREAEIRAAGEAKFRAINGIFHRAVFGKLSKLHPMIAQWLVERPYGALFGRPALAQREREFSIIASCMVLDTPIQQETHTKSAFIHGATYEQVIGAVDVAADLLGAEAGAVGRRVVEHVRELRAQFPHMWPQVEWAARAPAADLSRRGGVSR
jgi:4-carboxymuconolactone decarboxylase